MRTSTKIGDIFAARIDAQSKKYFQLIAFDSTQLNSDVIRAFEKTYDLNANPDLIDLVNGKVSFYAHCVTDVGLKMKLWQKAGTLMDVGDTKNIIFRHTSDYATKPGEAPIQTSDNWYIWRINDERFTEVSKLTGNYRNAEIGLVINPLGIIERLKGNKYPPLYPDFE